MIYKPSQHMTPTEVANFFKQPGEKRLAKFLETAHQEQCVFGISDDEGWAMLGDDDDTDIVPIFHDHSVAEAFRKAAGFDDCAVEKVPMDELFEWLDEMEEDEMMVAVCPNTRYEGAIVEPSQLKADLIKKIENQ
jgi:Protein of unknown function (DUF2750)